MTKILETAEQVAGDAGGVKIGKPKLKIAQKETAEKLVVVQAEEAKVNVQVEAVDKIVQACDKTK